MELEPVTSGHTLADQTLARIEMEVQDRYPSICFFAIVNADDRGPYYSSADGVTEATGNEFWEQRFTFLLLILAAEGEL
jgi:hypothetical protein